MASLDGHLPRDRGCAWCTPHRRGRWWRDVARACRPGARSPGSRPRTAAGTRRRRAPPGSGAGTAARRTRSWTPRQRSPRSTGRSASASARARGSSPASAVAVPAPVLEPAGHVRGEARDRRVPAVTGDPAQRGAGQVVVGMAAAAHPASVGQREDLRRAAAAALAVACCSRATTSPSASMASRCLRIAAGLSPSASPSSTAVAPPCSSRVGLDARPGTTVAHAGARPQRARPVHGARHGFHNDNVT